MNHGSISKHHRLRNRVRCGKTKQRKHHKSLKLFSLPVKWCWPYSGTTEAQFIGNLGMMQSSESVKTPTSTLRTTSRMPSSLKAQACSPRNHVYSTTTPNLISLIWSSSFWSTLNGMCLNTLRIRWILYEVTTTCSQALWKNCKAKDLPHTRNTLPQLNVYSRIWTFTSTIMVLRSSCLSSTNVHKKLGLHGEIVNFVLFQIHFFLIFWTLWIFQGLGDKTSSLPLIFQGHVW